MKLVATIVTSVMEKCSNFSTLSLSSTHTHTHTHTHTQHLYTLKVPGRQLSSLAWEGSGLRIALGVGSFIFFANIRHDYMVGGVGHHMCYWYSHRKCGGEYWCKYNWMLS